jgi:hypothetical protein
MIHPVDAELSRRIAERRTAETSRPLVTYCAGCRMAFAGCGVQTAHLADFMFTQDLTKAMTAKSPGDWARYLNRMRLKSAFKRLRPLGSE